MKFSNEAVDHIQLYGIDRRNRELYLFGRDDYVMGAADANSGESAVAEPGIEFSVANQFIRNLRVLQHEGSDPITIHLKTCGGDWHQGMAIHDAITHCPCEVTIVNWAEARSMSSIIFCAGDVRLMMPHSWFMYHEGDIGFAGTVKQFRSEAAQQDLLLGHMLDIYLDRARGSAFFKGQSDEAIVRHIKGQMLLKEEVYLTPEQAIEQGFATGMYEG